MNDLTFIESQFPVSKISKESYKERMANYSQTLTGLGKWWGRKPLVLVRATILGLLMPASDDPEKDREIFLKLMTMDSDGLWQRFLAKETRMKPAKIHEILTDEEHEDRVTKLIQNADLYGGLIGESEYEHIHEFLKQRYFIEKENGSLAWRKEIDDNAKELLTRLAFDALYYDEKIDLSSRPEQIEGPSKEAWKEINAHLNTSATNLKVLINQLGQRRFDHNPKVGDAFCGGGSIPFEAARLGCDVYASDLNPVAALLTWAAIHIVGCGPEVAEEVKKAQKEVYDAVDQQITEWGIEHNEKGHRADAYLYCVEVKDPETGWMVPLAPSWVVGEKTKTVAILIPDEKNKRYDIKIKMGATEAEMKQAKEGTIQKNYVSHPHNPNPIPMSMIRRENEGGLRMWENQDIVPRSDDVFQERLYCIRYVETSYEIQENKKWVTLNLEDYPDLQEKVNFKLALQEGRIREQTYRYYQTPDAHDLKNEDKASKLLKERFQEWQEKGFIPSRKIEPGDKTDEPIRNRGWTHWHHLFNPRQLLLNGLFLNFLYDKSIISAVSNLLGIARLLDRSAKLCIWDSSAANEKVANTFLNQALNTQYNYGARTWSSLKTNWFNNLNNITHINTNYHQEIVNVKLLKFDNDLWITDPPYADAVNYHELSEFFLSWYEKHIPKFFPDWATDSRRQLAIKGAEESFRRSMVEAYSNLTRHMPDNGLQVVMFTHQDAGVWADLAVILWASGLHVTAAWTIATETTSALKEGNYVQGTVLLVLRKNKSTETAFLDEMTGQIEEEVKAQVLSMEKIEDKEEPNFSDTDYQLAAYAAALRVITGYKQIEDIDLERELSRDKKDAKSPLENIIENARNVAASIRIPEGLDSLLWKMLSPEERYYLRGLDFEAKGENKAGAFQELARNYGVRNYEELLGSIKANETRVKTAKEFGTADMSGEGFDQSLLRHVLYAVYSSIQNDSVDSGRDYLYSEFPDYWNKRQTMISLLQYLARFEHSIKHNKDEYKMAGVLAGRLANDTA